MSEDKRTLQELWKAVLEQPLIEAEKRHKEKLKLKREQKKKGNKDV